MHHQVVQIRSRCIVIWKILVMTLKLINPKRQSNQHNTVYYEMLAVENIGEFGESILIHQNYTYQSFTVNMILSHDAS